MTVIYEAENVVASVQFEMWYFGLLLYQLCTLDGETVWKASQADELINVEDWDRLAYYFEEEKLRLTERILHSDKVHPKTKVRQSWSDAADLCL